MTGASQQSDLSWTAFRYISGEMSADEAETFEQQLAGDQSAREAVAVAVQITQAVASSSVESASVVARPASMGRGSAASGGKRALIWGAGTCAAICLAFLIGLKVQQNRTPQHGGSAGPFGFVADPSGSGEIGTGAARAERLLMLWSRSEVSVGSALDLELTGPPAGNSQSESTMGFTTALWDELFGEDVPGEQEEEFLVPDWMLAAAALPADRSPASARPEETPGWDAPVQEN